MCSVLSVTHFFLTPNVFFVTFWFHPAALVHSIELSTFSPLIQSNFQSKIPDADSVLYYEAIWDHFVIWSELPIVLEALDIIRLKLNL